MLLTGMPPAASYPDVVRIYLPATASDLAAAELSARPAHAVTARWRAENPDDDVEDGELVALLHAAADSVDLVGQGEVPVRVVVAAEVAAVTEGTDPMPTAVASPEVAWSDVVSIHVDDPADDDARAAVRAAATGDDDAVDVVAELDLLWFDVTEREALRALLLA